MDEGLFGSAPSERTSDARGLLCRFPRIKSLELRFSIPFYEIRICELENNSVSISMPKYRDGLIGVPEVERNFCLTLPGLCLAKHVHLLVHVCRLLTTYRRIGITSF